MVMRERYGKGTLMELLEDVSTSFKEEISGYLIGGLAMIFHGAKNVTKDIDIVFEDEVQGRHFRDCMLQNGFQEVELASDEYERMNTFTMIERPGSFRFDVFVRSVCNGLILSEGMKKRAKKIDLPGNLNLFIVSLEDIFLFKSITDRDDDLADMATIGRSRLDWEIIKEELHDQPDQWRWNTIFYQNLVALEEEYSILSPLRGEFEEMAEISIAMGLIITKLEKQPLPLREMIKVIDDPDTGFTEKVIDNLLEHDIIFEREGGYHLKSE